MKSKNSLAAAVAFTGSMLGCQQLDPLEKWAFEVPTPEQLSLIEQGFAHNQMVADLMEESFIPIAADDRLANITNEAGSRAMFLESIAMAENEFQQILAEERVYVFDPAVWGNKYSGAYEEGVGIGVNPNYDFIFRKNSQMLFTHEAAHTWASHTREYVNIGHNTKEQFRDYNLLTAVAIETHDFAAQLTMLGRDAGPLIGAYHRAIQSLDSDIAYWEKNEGTSSDTINTYLDRGPQGLWPEVLFSTFVSNYNPDNHTFDEFGIDNLHLYFMLKDSRLLESLRDQYREALLDRLVENQE